MQQQAWYFTLYLNFVVLDFCKPVVVLVVLVFVFVDFHQKPHNSSTPCLPIKRQHILLQLLALW